MKTKKRKYKKKLRKKAGTQSLATKKQITKIQEIRENLRILQEKLKEEENNLSKIPFAEKIQNTYKKIFSKKQKAATKIQRITRKNLSRKQKALEKINKSLIRLKKKQDLCPICLEKISKKNRVETKCGHFFHKRCLSNWCYINAKKNIMCRCPLCKQQLEEMTELKKAKANRIRERDIRDADAIRESALYLERLTQEVINRRRSNQNNN